MGRQRQGQAVQEFRYITERMPGKRVRFRVEVIPEIIAWMAMMSDRYTRTRLAAASANPGSSDHIVKRIKDECERREEAIQQLMNCLPDPWGVGRWEEVTTAIAKDFGIVIGEQLPDDVRDTARDHQLPKQG